MGSRASITVEVDIEDLWADESTVADAIRDAVLAELRLLVRKEMKTNTTVHDTVRSIVEYSVNKVLDRKES